eukprot:Gb_11950 [translate_table: standard]
MPFFFLRQKGKMVSLDYLTPLQQSAFHHVKINGAQCLAQAFQSHTCIHNEALQTSPKNFGSKMQCCNDWTQQQCLVRFHFHTSASIALTMKACSDAWMPLVC